MLSTRTYLTENSLQSGGIGSDQLTLSPNFIRIFLSQSRSPQLIAQDPNRVQTPFKYPENLAENLEILPNNYCFNQSSQSHKKRTLLLPLKLPAILLQLTHSRTPKILMMVTTWTVIMNLEAPEVIVCSLVHLCITRLLFRTVPAPAELTDKATIQSYYSRKARGQNTVHKQ